MKIIKRMSNQFKINNYNCFTNNYKIRHRHQLWNQLSTNNSSRRSNNPWSLNSNRKAQTPRWHRWYLSRYWACRSRWRKALGWCAIRSTWLRGGLRMRLASLRCWRSSRAKTKIGKCNVILHSLSNLGDSLTPSTSNNRRCGIKSWEWARSQIINSWLLNNSRWWEVVQRLNNNTIKEQRDRTDGSSKIHPRCFHLWTTINHSVMLVQRVRSRNHRLNSQNWQPCGPKS